MRDVTNRSDKAVWRVHFGVSSDLRCFMEWQVIRQEVSCCSPGPRASHCSWRASTLCPAPSTSTWGPGVSRQLWPSPLPDESSSESDLDYLLGHWQESNSLTQWLKQKHQCAGSCIFAGSKQWWLWGLVMPLARWPCSALLPSILWQLFSRGDKMSAGSLELDCLL